MNNPVYAIAKREDLPHINQTEKTIMHIVEIDQYRFYVDVNEYTPAERGSYDYNASSYWDYYGSSEQVEWECEKASFIRCSGNEVILDDEQREEALKDFSELIEGRLLKQIGDELEE